VRFLAFALLADFALFVPFFVRTEVRRFGFLSFLAMFNLQISQSKLCQHGTKSQPLNNLCTTARRLGNRRRFGLGRGPGSASGWLAAFSLLAAGILLGPLAL
jgi:hypothetical protein